MIKENQGKDLILRVVEIKGHCPVYKTGDEIYIKEGYILKSKRTCLHSLASVMPYYVALSHGIKPIDLGLAQHDDGTAYLQCLDPCEFTGGGTVIFRVERANER